MDEPPGVQAGEAHSTYATWIVVARSARLGVLAADALVACGLVLLMLFDWVGVSIPPARTAALQPPSPAQVALDIMPVKPGGPPEGYAGYAPSTVLSVPASSLVTVTIRNFDLDATPLPPGSPYAGVQGTANGVAYADGRAYSVLDPAGVAHTFTVPALHLSVPIPGHAAAGMRYVTVTFSFRTGSAGTYEWRCFAPCGDGPGGLAGPMADDTYMRGTLIVER